MSIDDFGDEVFLEWLQDCAKLFRSQRLEMEATAVVVDEILELINRTMSKIDQDGLKKLFTKYQNTMEIEFSNKGDYEKKIVIKLLDQSRKALTNYLTNTQNAFETSKRYERVKQRMNSNHNVETLRYLVIRDPQVDLEKRFIGLSYAYANFVNGVFRFSIQDCYTWEKISNGDNVDPDDIADMEVADIHNYYNQKSDLLYFEGFDSVVRNAVAHSNFEFDPITGEITYVAEGRREISPTGTLTTNRQTVTYSFEQMVENYQKLEKIYELVLITNQVPKVSTCLAKLTERHP